MRKVVYTAIFDNYESLKKPEVKTPGWDYLCYTDNMDTTSDDWKVVHVEQSELGAVKSARQKKINLVPKYDMSVWVDGSIQIKCNLDLFCAHYFASDKGCEMALMNHTGRNCAYDEATACIRIGKDSVAVMAEQMNRYKSEGYPEKYGLVATGVIVRLHTPAVRKFCKAWWNEVKKGSQRDQLSFNYTHWKNPITYNTFPFEVIYDREFLLNRHGK